MQIKDEDRWRFLTECGKMDVFVYEDGAVGFIPLKDICPPLHPPNFGGKDWRSAVDNGIKKFVNAGLFKL